MAPKIHGLNGMHTAGIFSDMTVDGPEIGTLVVIVDRAKNLPNRKTIGKQDPYCAARLGKEAKKTDTDRRGGQTPRWDQELRYTVHDSPDYYQLKVSVFNDDKKTDLIGECWVDLKEVVILGGGQNDLWHTLSCKGKYAGEIRIEITYYDTRPKAERAEKMKQAATNGAEEGGRDSLRGPRQAKAGVKRRPLPSDPVTGEAPPLAIPDHVQTPPRGLPPSPGGAPDYAGSPTRGYPSAIPDHVATPTRSYQNSPHGIPDHVHTPPREYQTPPTAIPEHVRTPQSRYQSPGYIPNQSPLQSVEYNSGSRYSSHGIESPAGYGSPVGAMASSPASREQPNEERYELHDSVPESRHGQRNQRRRYEEEEVDPRDQYDSRHVSYDIPPSADFGSPPSPGGPPPPPPAHRSRNGSSQPSPAAAPAVLTNRTYGYGQDNRNSDRYSTPPHEAHRHSMPAYTHSKSYEAYSLERHQDQFRHSANEQVSPPRHHSYDSRYNGDYGSMQPTVEDAPPSPAGASYAGRRSSRTSQYNDPRYDKVPSPAPLNLSGRGSAASGRNSMSAVSTHQYSNSSVGYNPTNSQLSFRDRSEVSSQTSYNSGSQQPYRPRSRGQSANEMADSYGLPEVPATLVAGMDPTIAQELSERIHAEKRGTHGQSASNSARGRYQDSPQYQQTQLRSFHDSAPVSSSFDERQSRFSAAAVPVQRPRAQSPNPPPSGRGVSPSPRTSISRKSVSPAPRLSDDQRRLSGIPFGPDSYNALNPALTGSASAPSLAAAYDTKLADPDAKIITHDGREIDPSDHIPESNYAPLLESKGPKYASQQPDRNYRPPPGSTQPASATGRRPLRQAGRPHPTTAASSPSYVSNNPYDPNTPPAGRNRLQKKANRVSAQPAPQSSPLGPVSAYQDNSFTPPSLPRAHTMDYSSSENYAPQQYGSSPGYRAGAPPIPAKVPMGRPPSSRSGEGDPWALLEEMKNIDLGSGGTRRRGY